MFIDADGSLVESAGNDKDYTGPLKDESYDYGFSLSVTYGWSKVIKEILSITLQYSWKLTADIKQKIIWEED